MIFLWYHSFMATTTNCEVCGKEVPLKGGKRFCSPCRNARIKAQRKKRYRSKNPKHTRWGKCKDCGKKIKLVTNKYRCSECTKKAIKRYRKEYKQRPEVKRRAALYQRKWRKEHPKRHLESVKRRVKRGRERVFNKLGRRCMRCGYDEFEECLEIHHIDSGRKERDDWMRKDFDDWENLMVLCCNCHNAHHRVGTTLS